MDAACVKRSLVKQIQKLSEHPELYCRSPGRDFTRKRKLPFCTLISFILNMRGGPLTSEIIDFFSNEKSIVSSSAVVQMRDKLKPEAFRSLLINFNSQMENMEQPETENGLRILAVDGSDIQMPMNPDDEDSFYPGVNGQKPYNLIHLNALYDLLQRTYLDAVIQKSRKQNEHKALIELAESSPIEKALVIVDRGYESYNTFAHIHERGWFYLARIKDGKNGIVSGLDLPADDEFDLEISMNLTRSSTNEVKELCKDKNHYRYVPKNMNFDYLPLLTGTYGTKTVFYNLEYRIVRVRISDDLLETLITNLPADQYPSERLKELYALRWGIETSFRDIKYAAGMLFFHSRKKQLLLQEIYAKLILYNFSEAVTGGIVVQKRKGNMQYSINFTIAVSLCVEFIRRSSNGADLFELDDLISRHLVPVRPGRSSPRYIRARTATSFLYR